MGKLIEENILDPTIREWIIPNFSTTKIEDEITASMIMMSTFQAYFDYTAYIDCGLPSVTLEGEKTDWAKLEMKLEKLKDFGDENLDMWYGLMKPVLARFVKSFEAADSQEVKDFWAKVVHYQRNGSGPDYVSGWLTAFTYFSTEGKVLYDSRVTSNPEDFNWSGRPLEILKLDDALYSRIAISDIPAGNCQVPVKIDDNGEIIESKIAVGMVGMKAVDKHEKCADTLRPVSGWWIFEKGN